MHGRHAAPGRGQEARPGADVGVRPWSPRPGPGCEGPRPPSRVCPPWPGASGSRGGRDGRVWGQWCRGRRGRSGPSRLRAVLARAGGVRTPGSDSPSELCLLPAVTAPCPPGALGNLALTWSSGAPWQGPGRPSRGQHAARLSGVWEPCKPELLVSEDEEGPATRSGRGSRSQRGRVPPLRGVVPPLRGSAARREPAPREPGARPRGRLSCVARGLASPHQRREWGAECRGADSRGADSRGVDSRGADSRGATSAHAGTGDPLENVLQAGNPRAAPW